MRKYRHTTVLLALAALLALPAATDAQRSREGTARRGWIGIRPWFSLTVIDGHRTESMMVADVVEDSPADRAGIRPGDRILRINGKDASEQSLNELARGLEPGDTVRLRIASGGRDRDISVVAVEQPRSIVAMNLRAFAPRDSIITKARIYMDSAMRVLADTALIFRLERNGPRGFIFPSDSFTLRVLSRPGWFVDPGAHIRVHTDEFEFPRIEFFGARSVSGAEFAELNEGLSSYFGTNTGLLVLKVSPGTPADEAGLEPGDVITRANGREVRTVMDLRREVMRTNGPVPLDVLRKGQKRTVRL